MARGTRMNNDSRQTDVCRSGRRIPVPSARYGLTRRAHINRRLIPTETKLNRTNALIRTICPMLIVSVCVIYDPVFPKPDKNLTQSDL